MTKEEAQQAWKKMRSEIDETNWLFVGTINPQMVDMAIEALQNRPSGKWIVKYGAHYDVLVKECYCDQCGKRGGLATMLFDDKPLPNFCGHCGADMRGSNNA